MASVGSRGSAAFPRPPYSAPETEELSEGEESDNDLEVLHPDHPAMQRVQAALRKQLARRKEEIDFELRERTRKFDERKKEREEVGIQLYSAQQQLARLQGTLEKSQDSRQEFSATRTKSEELAKIAKKDFEALKQRQDGLRKQANDVQGQYAQLRATLLTLERHQEELESKVAVSKRAVVKAAKDQDKLEEVKQRQDLFVDKLVERAKELEAEIKVTKAQLVAQEAESKVAEQAVLEAQSEVKEITQRKKEIHQLWQNSLAGLTKRNDALATMQTAVREQEQEFYAKDREVEGVQKLIHAEQEKNENITGQQTRLNNEISVVERRLEQVQEKTDDIKRQFNVVTRSMKDTEEKLARVTQEVNIFFTNVKLLRDKCDRLALEKTDLDQRLVVQLQGKLTVDKASKNVAKLISDLRAAMLRQEAEHAEVENDIARKEMEASDIRFAIENQREQLVKAEAEGKELNEMLAKFDGEIKRNTVAIEKKQKAIDAINKRIQAIQARLAAESNGNMDVTPGEIEISNLRFEILDVNKENAEHQRRWLARQSELVACEKEIDDHQTAIEELRTQNSVLSQKQARVSAEVEQQRTELAKLQRDFKQLQNELVRLNTLITRNKGRQEELQQANSVLEDDFLKKLKGEELEIIQIQETIDSMLEEKERLLNAVIEAERQLLLWEKKIQLARETKAELNPNGPNEETEAMKKEIHRMQLRLQQLERQKEELIVQMERSVDRRDTITSKAKLQATKTTSPSTGVKKEIVDLKKKVKQSLEDAEQCAQEIQRLEEDTASLHRDINMKQSNVSRLRDLVGEYHERVQRLLRARSKNLEDIVRFQQLTKHLESAESGKLRLACKDVESYNREIEKQLQKLQSLNSITEYLARNNPAIEQALRDVRANINSRINEVLGQVQE